MKPWCTEPFDVLENKVWGNWGLCCRSAPLPYSAKNISPIEHFNSDLMKQIRRDMLDHNISDDIKKYCHKCLEHERNNVESIRQQRIKISNNFKPIQSAIDNNGEIKDFNFRSVEIKFFGNLCNLKCRMCGPEYSSSIAAEQKKQGIYSGPTHINAYADMSNKEQFYSDLDQILPYTKILKFTGGEPMMNEGIQNLIQYAVDKDYSNNIILKIITNGTKINQKLLKLSSKFKMFWAEVSVDGLWEINDYQRTGSNFHDINSNIKILKQYGKVSLTTTITAINVHQLEDLISYSKYLNVDLSLGSIAITPLYLQVKVLPIGYRNKLIEKYKDIRECKVAVKALKDPEWDLKLFEKFLFTNPDICDIIEELKEWI